LTESFPKVSVLINYYTCELKESKLLAMSQNPDIRWKQRFQNFDRAFVLLRDALENGPSSLNQLEKEGVIQRFEFCFELAWKTLKDYMEQDGFVFATITPRQVIKDAFAAQILKHGQVWIDMLDHRNLLSHTYNLVKFEEAIMALYDHYLDAFDQLHEFLQEKLTE
jgi:nucleotidyltransferase substrate binding protein (TIGR01987 family)